MKDKTNPRLRGAIGKGRRQVHIWVSEADDDWLRLQAEKNDETISATVRRLIRVQRTGPRQTLS